MHKPTYPGSEVDPRHPHKKKITLVGLLKIFTGLCLAILVIWFISWNIQRSKTYQQLKLSSDIEQLSVAGGYKINVLPYTKGNITYLIFLADEGLQIQNYTADSLRLVEYNDYEASIKDTLFSQKLFDQPFKNVYGLNPALSATGYLVVDNNGSLQYSSK